MRLFPGSSIKPFELPALNAELWSSEALAGRPCLLAFFRFAACPFCNLRVNQLTKFSQQLPDEFVIVAVFDSPLDNLQRYAEKHQAPFPILADEGGLVHKLYGVEHSWAGVLKGLIWRFPALLRGLLKGYWPFRFKGKLNTMPADFLITADGVIAQAYYAADEGDHMPLADILAFAQAPALKS